MPLLPSPQLEQAVATTLAPPFEVVPQHVARVLYGIELHRTEVDISVKTKQPMADVSTCRRTVNHGSYHDWSSFYLSCSRDCATQQNNGRHWLYQSQRLAHGALRT